MKVFHYEETEVPVIKYKDEDPEDKRKLSELGLKSK